MAAERKEYSMKKGINICCFPDEFSLEQCFALACENGYDGIELNMLEDSTQNPALTLNGKTDTPDSGWNAILKLSEKYRLPISSISTILHWKYPLTDSDPVKRQKGEDIVCQMIDAAKLLGCNTVLVVPGLVTKDVSYKTAYERSLEAFCKLKEYAEKAEIIIGIENVWNKFLLSPLEMAGFIDTINSTYVKAYFDAGNVLQYSYPEHWAEVLGERISKVHIKDFDVSIGNISGFTNLLAGDMDWKPLINTLRAVGYDDYITAELSPYKQYPEQLIKDTKHALDLILDPV